MRKRGPVERSLYERANGYNYEAVKIFMPADRANLCTRRTSSTFHLTAGSMELSRLMLK
jgi:hypothetical protein